MPSPAGLPPGVESQQIETSRLRTHVLTAGPPDAPPLVLVHGNVSAAAVTGFLASVPAR
jgi:hypothetical protein